MYSASNTNISVSNNMNTIVRSNISFNAENGSFYAQANNNNMYLNMHTYDNQLTLNTSSNMKLYANSNMLLQAYSNMVVEAVNGNLSISAAANLVNMYFNSLNNTYSLFSQSDSTLTQSNSLYVNTRVNTTFSNNTGSFGVNVPQNIILNANNSNAYVNVLGGTTNSVSIYGLSNVNTEAVNTIKSTAGIDILMNAARDVTLSAGRDVNLTAIRNLNLSYNSMGLVGAADSSFTAQSNINFFITASENPNTPVFNISSNLVRIDGDMFISGNITTSNVYNTTVIQNSLTITDKTITLATSGSNTENIFDANYDSLVTNSGGGMVIEGFPQSSGLSNGQVLNPTIISAYEKSIKWNYNANGMDDLGQSGTGGTEALWELKGGQLRLTYVNPTNNMQTSFGFRINDVQELEIVKHFCTNQSLSNNTDPTQWTYTTERIARFGRFI